MSSTTSAMHTANTVSHHLVEVGPRDGLQNEPTPLTTADRIEFVERLADAGFSVVETGSFVSPRWVPQMAASKDVFAGIKRNPAVRYSALVPNERGYDDARDVAVDEVAVFAAASESFSQKNLNCSIEESFERFAPIVERAQADGLPVRGYLSCVLGCPYEGNIAPQVVAQLSERLLAAGCYEVSLGDTIGVGTAGSTRSMLQAIAASGVPAASLAMHCHDTYGQALSNILVGLEHDITVFDSSTAGLGGCPYAKGASGNVATEDLLYMLTGLGINHGIDLHKVVEAGRYITGKLGIANRSKVATALLAKDDQAV